MISFEFLLIFEHSFWIITSFRTFILFHIICNISYKFNMISFELVSIHMDSHEFTWNRNISYGCSNARKMLFEFQEFSWIYIYIYIIIWMRNMSFEFMISFKVPYEIKRVHLNAYEAIWNQKQNILNEFIWFCFMVSSEFHMKYHIYLFFHS